MLIHYRYASHGIINDENCHPFFVEDNKLAFIHNGILPTQYQTLSYETPEHSDTWFFNEIYLKPLYKKCPRFYATNMQDIEAHIKSSMNNKLCFLDSEGNYAIANEKMGYWDNGVWFSNDSCRIIKKRRIAGE